MKRRLLNVMVVISLLLFVTTVVLWVRSYWRSDYYKPQSRQACVFTQPGALWFTFANRPARDSTSSNWPIESDTFQGKITATRGAFPQRSFFVEEIDALFWLMAEYQLLRGYDVRSVLTTVKESDKIDLARHREAGGGVSRNFVRQLRGGRIEPLIDFHCASTAAPHPIETALRPAILASSRFQPRRGAVRGYSFDLQRRPDYERVTDSVENWRCKQGARRMSEGNLAHKAYEHLQENIVSGKLISGAVISEAAVAKELGISRTPVGEAIRQLQREGLVEQVPRYGTIVRSWDLRELIELYEMREALETYATGRAAERITAEQLHRLSQYCQVIRRIDQELSQSGEATLNDATLRRFLAADMAFHLTIIEATGNRRILDVVKNMRTISRIFRAQRAWHDQRITRNTCEDHEKILKALKDGDAAAATNLMAEHIRGSKQESLNQHQQVMASTGFQHDLPADLQRELDAMEQEAGRPARPIVEKPARRARPAKRTRRT